MKNKIKQAEKKQQNGTQDQEDDKLSEASTDSLPPPNIERMQQMKKQFAVTMDDEGNRMGNDEEEETVMTLESEMENENRINTFEEINWKDPFPAKVNSKKKKGVRLQEAKVDELVYSEARFNPMRPPNLTFIPSK